MIKFARKWFQTPSMAPLTPLELVPGAAVTTDEGLAAVIKASSYPSIGHPLGTCAMMPKALGGVVGTDLKVHGVGKLRIVDSSIMPLAPGTHLDTTVYAVAERAADLIKATK